ncbi:50S ribosomal protein L18 [Candidatus Odyssella thessalonicensis]|uniref:50S ribosomal protein L18 n=1 Tax=Candidatus Odyssella thessalonicensis TaxID=84647 RepID=UPI000225BC83|nr:50S ribosomal protein L18 [Candidatus Odyssella thessalonicensis]
MSKIDLHTRRKERIRSKLRKVSSGKPRLTVHRSSKYLYAQVIDDIKSITIAAASSLEAATKSDLKNTSNLEAAKLIGKLIAERANKAGVKEVVFDRSGYRFHGRIKAIADAARESGLSF